MTVAGHPTPPVRMIDMTKTQYALLAVTILVIVSGTIIAILRRVDAGLFVILLAVIPAFIMVVVGDD